MQYSGTTTTATNKTVHQADITLTGSDRHRRHHGHGRGRDYGHDDGDCCALPHRQPPPCNET